MLGARHLRQLRLRSEASGHFLSNIISIYIYNVYVYNIIYIQVLDIYVNYDCDLKQVDVFFSNIISIYLSIYII
jgi:hypothetical protein